MNIAFDTGSEKKSSRAKYDFEIPTIIVCSLAYTKTTYYINARSHQISAFSYHNSSYYQHINLSCTKCLANSSKATLVPKREAHLKTFLVSLERDSLELHDYSSNYRGNSLH
jgi:hypothetical protein